MARHTSLRETAASGSSVTATSWDAQPALPISSQDKAIENIQYLPGIPADKPFRQFIPFLATRPCEPLVNEGAPDRGRHASDRVMRDYS
jgi:hypothetical protein